MEPGAPPYAPPMPVEGEIPLPGELPGEVYRLGAVLGEKLPTGQVKQHWRTSTDGGKTWADAFVGIYTKR